MTEKTRLRTPAAQRLRHFPSVFSLADLRQDGLTQGSAKVAISEWKSAGYVKAAGPRLGIYYNLVVDRLGADEHLGTVLRATFGSPVVIGCTSLNDAGWTLQIPHALSVAVPSSRTYPAVDGATTYGRNQDWYSKIYPAIKHSDAGRFKLPTLPPEWALADALANQDCLHNLQPDDIEIPDGVDIESLLAALTSLMVPVDVYRPYLANSGIQFDSLNSPNTQFRR